MALESQSTVAEVLDRQIAELADELQRNLSRELWEASE
jgi:hypothetical protein